jgi:hypothetical protein
MLRISAELSEGRKWIPSVCSQSKEPSVLSTDYIHKIWHAITKKLYSTNQLLSLTYEKLFLIYESKHAIAYRSTATNVLPYSVLQFRLSYALLILLHLS